MILKGLVTILLLLLAVLAVAGLVILRFLYKGVRFFKRWTDEDDARTNRHNRDYTGRRQQQYGFYGKAGDGTSRQGQGSGTGTQQHVHTDEGNTITDLRNPRNKGPRIISDDEGEYVEFTEE
ncbi:MAG: DUF4834 family protein [Prevotella sp.]